MASMIGKDEMETTITEDGCEREADMVKQVEREAETSSGDGEDSGEWFTRRNHPLRNGVILEIFFQNVRAKKDLKTCRGVCKFWNKLAIPFVRSNFRVTIDGNQNQLENDNSDTRGIDQFVQVFRQSSIGIPFEKFQLGAFGTTDGAGKEFLNLCGEKIKDIAFNYIEFGNVVHHMIEDLAETLKCSPNLEYLTLAGHMSSKSGEVVELFTENSKPTLPNLKTLKMQDIMISLPKSKFSSIQIDEQKKCCPTFIEELLDMAPNISDFCTLSFPWD